MSFPKFTLELLPNNIKLLWIPVKNVKTISVSITINSGYYEEEKNEVGLAHFLEHMIARYLRDGPVMEKIRKKGIVVSTNAYTSVFRTSYYAYGDSKCSSDILELILKTYFYREIDKKLFENERNAVLVEMKNKISKKENIALFSELPKMIFGKNTKVQSNMAKHIEVVSKAKEEDLIKFMKLNYLSGRTTITISGNYNKSKLSEILKKEIIKIPKTPHLKKRIVKQLKEGIFPKIKVVEDKQRKVVLLNLTFLIFNTYNYKNKYCAQLLENILSRIGDSSILFDRLRSKLGVTYSPSVDIEFDAYNGQFDFNMDIEAKNIEKTLRELVKIIKELKTELIDEQLIKLAKSRVELDIKNDMYNIKPQKYLKYTDKVIDNEDIIPPQQIYNNYFKNYSAKDLRLLARNMFKIDKCYLVLVGKCGISNQKLKNILKDI